MVSIQTESLSLWTSNITSDGFGGVQGGGGGSGGSIAVDYFHMTLTGSNFMEANGGEARSSGGGGRVRVWNHRWKYEGLTLGGIDSQENGTIRIEASGGGGCSAELGCGQAGSIASSPCPPGLYLDQDTLMCL